MPVVVLKGSNHLSPISGSTRSPVFSNRTTTSPPSSPPLTRTRPFFPANLMALLSKFENKADASAGKIGGETSDSGISLRTSIPCFSADAEKNSLMGSKRWRSFKRERLRRLSMPVISVRYTPLRFTRSRRSLASARSSLNRF